ncbi:S8 family peptidase [Haliangium sp.]|uniref:S8 family peptidase n=1 Tax=Haliangium sp. TaxID=2663208 RepID=UPI003D11AFAA
MKTRMWSWFLAAGFTASSLLVGCAQQADDVVERDAVGAPLLFFDSPTAVPDQYIVVFKEEISTQSVSSFANRISLRGDNSKIQHSYASMPAFAATLSPAALEELRMDPSVAYIEQDQVVTLDAVDTTDVPNGLDRVDQRTGRNGAYDDFGRRGAGVHVYIIDTGINASHQEFTGRIGAGHDAVDNDSNPDDCQGHGTHVSSTSAGSQYGLAKNATLHGVRVLNCQGSGTNAGVIAGIDFVTANHISPAVANMSLGGSKSQALNDAVARSVAAGVTYAVAAGNESTDACTKSPASEPSAITVGATEDTSDARASFSNFGSCVDMFAPGRNIKGAWIGSSSATNTISGTSMASPHMAGAAALVLGDNPGFSPAQVQAALEGVATEGCVTSAGSNSPNLLLHTNLSATDAGPHCGGGDPGDPGDPNPNSCVENNACGGSAPGGCGCDIWCSWFGDCCADGPC